MEQSYDGLSDVPPLCLTPSYPVCGSDGDGNHQDAAHNELLSGIQNLRINHTSGAKELAAQAIATLVRIAAIAGAGSEQDDESMLHCQTKESSASERWWETTRRAAWAIAKYGRPSVGAAITSAVVNLMDHTRQEIAQHERDHSGFDDADVVRSAVENMQGSLRQRLHEQQPMVGVQLRNFIRQNFQHRVDECGNLELNVLTLSCSSTIRLGLMTLLETGSEQGGNVSLRLRVMESRPLCEGVDLARQLVGYAEAKGLEKKLKIEIASDASAAILSRSVDLVLLGADRVSSEGDISNKMGSLPAVLTAKMVSKDALVIAITELEKIARPGRMEDHGDEDNDTAELVSLWNDKLGDRLPGAWEQTTTVRNVYFEWVPANLIDHYICEIGLLNVESIREHSDTAVKREQQLFGDLDEAAAAAHWVYPTNQSGTER